MNRFKFVLSCCLLSVASSIYAEESLIDKQCVPEGEWITSQGKTLDKNSVMNTLSKTKVVLLGEDHDNPEHHRWQLHTIAGIYAHEPKMILGFEAFPRSTQKYLDQWVAGEIEEKEFLEVVEWDKIWRFNKDFYMPMFHFARMNNIPMYALNVERKLVAMVSQQGWDSIDDKSKEGVSKPASPSLEYLEVLASVYAQHMPKHGSPNSHEKSTEDSELSEEDFRKIMENPRFRSFVEGQSVWDRAMAEKIHQAITKDKHTMLVGVMGAGHVMGDYGVPHQLNDLGTESITTLMAWDGTVECDELKNAAVDIAYGIRVVKTVDEEDKKPHLGVYLDHAGKDVVIVTRLVEKSVAEKTGIQVDDQIVEVAGKKVTKVTDVVERVKASAFGTWLPIKVLRDEKEIELVAKFPPLEDE